MLMLYNKNKLVRFTGVPLIVSGVWRLTLIIKNKQRIKTNQCAPMGGRVTAKPAERPVFIVLF